MNRMEIIIGPMFSGKSTELLRRAGRYEAIGKNVLYINYYLDQRYGKMNDITTHDKKSKKALMIQELMSVLHTEEYKSCDIIAINEAQFFKDLYPFCKEALYKQKKYIILAGLDGDYNKNPFGDILKLIPHCDTLIKLHALCHYCGVEAQFTKRITEDASQIVIGGKECYVPACREHYH